MTYPAGTVAMANTGQPHTGGSQFFLVYKDSQLPPSYTPFGTIDEAGLKVLKKIADGRASRRRPGRGAQDRRTVQKAPSTRLTGRQVLRPPASGRTAKFRSRRMRTAGAPVAYVGVVQGGRARPDGNCGRCPGAASPSRHHVEEAL